MGALRGPSCAPAAPLPSSQPHVLPRVELSRAEGSAVAPIGQAAVASHNHGLWLGTTGLALVAWASQQRRRLRHRRAGLARRSPLLRARSEVAEQWVQEQVSKTDRQDLLDAALAELGLAAVGDTPSPARNQEPWRYTDLKALFSKDTASAAPDDEALQASALPLLEVSTEGKVRLVFVDGVLSEGLSSQKQHGSLQQGFIVGSARALIAQNEELKGKIGELLAPLPEKDIFLSNHRDALGCAPFAALNQSLLQDCAYISCPGDGVGLSKDPLQVEVVFISTGSASACSCPRVLIQAGEQSRLHVVESHLSLGPKDSSMSNGICRVLLADSAEVHHDFLQQRAEGARLVHSITAEVGPGACYNFRQVQSGCRVARVNVAVALIGEGSSCEVDGVMLADGRQQLDLHSLIHHVQPGCSSKQRHKNVVAGAAECIFKGSIRVDKEAQQTDSEQICRTLLLSKKAKVKAMPSLQIRADDVTCSHGAAITELDEHQVFYMKSRGLGVEDARKLLLVAFPQDLLKKLEKTAPKAYGRVLQKLKALAEAPLPDGGQH